MADNTAAVLNSSPELITAFSEALEGAGFAVVAAHVADIQDGSLDLVAWIDVHDPAVILYDLPRPFERHWNFLRLLRETDSLKARCWVLTTTDKKSVEAVIDPSTMAETLIGTPFTMEEAVAAVRACIDRVGAPAAQV